MLTKHPPNPSIIYSDAYWSGRTASSSKENFPWIPWHSSGGTSTDCGGRNPVLITQVKNGGQGLKHVCSQVVTGLPFLTPPKGRNYAVPINRRADWWNAVYTQIEYYSAIKEKKHWHKNGWTLKILLNEVSQPQEDKYCTMRSRGGVKIRRLHKISKQQGGCERLGQGRMGREVECCLVGTQFLIKKMHNFVTVLVPQHHTLNNAPNGKPGFIWPKLQTCTPGQTVRWAHCQEARQDGGSPHLCGACLVQL